MGTLLASLLAEGSVAAIGYAFRLVQYPIGVVGVSIATGALPVMSAAVARDAVGDMKHALRDSLRLGIFLALPATIGLVTFATPIVTVLFERGAFTRSATLLTASILSAYALGLVFYIANRILAPAFYAMRDTWAPMATGMVSVGVNIVASVVLMGHLGAVGLGVATAVASASNCAQLVYRLRRRVGVLGGRTILRAGGRVALACAPMAVWGVGSQLWWNTMEIPSLVGRAGVLALQLGVAAIVFGVAALAVRCEELGWAWDLVRRRARRSRAPDRS
jgi:putative peptidoglycan lipid II flippase